MKRLLADIWYTESCDEDVYFDVDVLWFDGLISQFTVTE